MYTACSLPPAAFAIKATVVLCFTFLPPWHWDPFLPNPWSGRVLYKNPVSPRFQMCSGAYPWRSSGILSFHDSTVIPLFSWFPMYLEMPNVVSLLYLYNHPLDTLKSDIWRCSAISWPSHTAVVQLDEIFFEQVMRYYLCSASLISENLQDLALFCEQTLPLQAFAL